jgi:tRNA threonylcarbamoyladenosine modification (KEOPS) complex  Pcc1 subunit
VTSTNSVDGVHSPIPSDCHEEGARHCKTTTTPMARLTVQQSSFDFNLKKTRKTMEIRLEVFGILNGTCLNYLRWQRICFREMGD